VLSGATLSGHNAGADLCDNPGLVAYDTVFGGPVENSTGIAEHDYNESINHNTVAGAYRAWTRGGNTSSQIVTVPPGRTLAYRLVPASATYRIHYRRAYTVQPGETLSLTAWLRKDAAMAYLPRVQIVDPADDELADATAVALAEWQMTDSLNTWESSSLTWPNTGTLPKEVWVRAMAKNATGSVYTDWAVTGGGAVQISPYRGMIG